MQHNITRHSDGATYADEYPPPPPPSVTPSVATPTNDVTLGPIALLANILITAIIITAMLVDGTTARTAIIAGAIYFAVSGFVFAIVTTGTLASIVNAWQREATERQRVAAYLALGTMALRWRMEVERNRWVEGDASPYDGGRVPLYPAVESAQGTQRVSPLTTFVAPYADEQQAALEGVAWAEKLYERSALGAPDPRKVHPDGRLRQRMIGSKRGGGSREAGVWLIQRGVIVRVAGGYSLNLREYPYRHYVTAIVP